jgi:4-hydroxy-tetrahydrodipicolinate synthase
LAPSRLKPIVDPRGRARRAHPGANGNTGEFYSLTTAEAEAMVHARRSWSRGRVPLLAGVGRSINDACTLARAIARRRRQRRMGSTSQPDPFVSPRGVVT